MNDKTSYVKSGIGFDGLLIFTGILFCILRGAGAITWDWIFCCIPFIIVGCELGLAILIIIICAVIAMIAQCYDYNRRFKHRPK